MLKELLPEIKIPETDPIEEPDAKKPKMEVKKVSKTLIKKNI
jgi:hypothetical protein